MAAAEVRRVAVVAGGGRRCFGARRRAQGGETDGDPNRAAPRRLDREAAGGGRRRGGFRVPAVGLARETGDADAPAGAFRYLSPEVLSRPAEEGDDFWSLCVVLYEMVSGRYPFGSGRPGEVADRIRRQRLAGTEPTPGAEPVAAVLAFAASMLTARRSARPATARAFVGTLRGASGKS